jgi:penicillin-insensitive murein endopeptidase
VGDLSARFGGAASGHRSHRTGRDADLLIYALTPDGRPVASPGFLEFGPDGLASTEDGALFRIDIEREWLLIKALLNAPDAAVQWLFIARWLEALIIEHARARGEDPELVWHAETVLLQPRDSADHDDHLHLRIACPPPEAVEGCLGGGPYWPWLEGLPELASPPDVELADALIGDLLPGAPAEVAQASAPAEPPPPPP